MKTFVEQNKDVNATLAIKESQKIRYEGLLNDVDYTFITAYAIE